MDQHTEGSEPKTTPKFSVFIQAKQQQPSHWYVFWKIKPNFKLPVF